MEHLKEIFRKNRQIYDGSDKMVIQLFKSAFSGENEETVNGLIFPGSPVISYKDPLKDHTFLQILICQSRLILDRPNIVIAQLLIDYGINIDNQNTEGNTALHLNTMMYCSPDDGQLDVTRVLLKNGANREIRNKDGLTPLQLNLYMGRLDIAEEYLRKEDKLPNVTEVEKTKRCQHLVKCLLKERNDWNIPSTNYSVLLHFLILKNDEETFEYVVKNTIFDVNAVNLQENKLIHLAAERGTPRMIRALVNRGADPDAYSKLYRTPLISAIRETRTKIFHSLIDCGASVNKVEKRGQTIMCENSPLQYAVCRQNFEMVERLVKMGADVNARSYHRSPLLLACGSIFSSKWSRYHDLSLKYFFYRNDNSGGNYLSHNIHYFSFSAKIVEVLLDHGADITAKNASNRTSLDQACRCGKLDIVKLLLSRGAEINKGDVSTLHHAVRGQNPAVVRLILDQGANVYFRCAPERRMNDCPDGPDAKIPPPRTPLECALVFIRQDLICKNILEILLEYDINLNVANPKTGKTPLYLACFSERVRGSTEGVIASRQATLRFLLKHNANVNALDSTGLLPLDCVKFASFWSSARLFKPILETVIAFIAKLIATKGCVIKEIFELLKDSDIQQFYQKCVKELSLMKENICESRNFSFFNILTKDIDYLGNVLKDEHILQVLNSGEYKKNFPIYAEFLEDCILETSIRQRLVELAIVLFQKYVHENFSVCLMLEIFQYLHVRNLKNFVKACFVDVE